MTLMIWFFLLIRLTIQWIIFFQVSQSKIEWKSVILIQILLGIFAIFAGVLSYFLFFIFLIFYQYHVNSRQSWQLNLFFLVYEGAVVDFLYRFNGLVVFPLITSHSINYISTSTLWEGISLALILPMHYLLQHSFGIDFKLISKLSIGKSNKELNRLYLPITMSLIICYTFMFFSFIFSTPVIDLSNVRRLLSTVYFIVYLAMLSGLNKFAKEQLLTNIQVQKDCQISNLEEYNTHVEELYKELRNFKHDYANLLLTLEEGIKNHNLKSIEQVYRTVIKGSDKLMQTQNHDLGRLSYIKNSAIKSVLSAKFLQAQDLGIKVSIEIWQDILEPRMELLDFITILGVLCDNAIEATIETENPYIRIAYAINQNKQILILENSSKRFSDNIPQLYQMGFSIKGGNRGLGLAHVKSILNNYPDDFIRTESYDYNFKQQLELENK